MSRGQQGNSGCSVEIEVLVAAGMKADGCLGGYCRIMAWTTGSKRNKRQRRNAINYLNIYDQPTTNQRSINFNNEILSVIDNILK